MGKKKYQIPSDAGLTTSLTDVASTNIIRLVSASSELFIFQETTPNHLLNTDAETLNLTDEATITSNILDNSIVEILNLKHYNIVGPIRYNPKFQLDGLVMNLTQSVIASISSGKATSTLFLTQNVNGQKPNTNVSHFFGLLSTASSGKVYNIGLTSFLSLGDSGASTFILTASSHIQLSQSGETVLYDELNDVLVLTHTVSISSSAPLAGVLNLTQTLDADLVYTRSASNVLNLNVIYNDITGDDDYPSASSDNWILGSTLRQYVTLYRPTLDFCEYAGSNEPPVLTKRSTIILTYPYPIYRYILELRNPVFDDTEQLEFRRINRYTRGGELKLFRDPNWPDAKRLIYSFDNLKPSESFGYLEFIKYSLGKEIGLLDYESRQWRGIIITPDGPVEEEDRPGFSLTFEFEGIIDTGGLSAQPSPGATVTAAPGEG